MRNTAPTDAAEIEALETREWLESLEYVLKAGGPQRVSQLLRQLGDHAGHPSGAPRARCAPLGA